MPFEFDENDPYAGVFRQQTAEHEQWFARRETSLLVAIVVVLIAAGISAIMPSTLRWIGLVIVAAACAVAMAVRIQLWWQSRRDRSAVSKLVRDIQTDAPGVIGDADVVLLNAMSTRPWPAHYADPIVLALVNALKNGRDHSLFLRRVCATRIESKALDYARSVLRTLKR